MDEKVNKIISLIEDSELDRTIKDILIRDIKSDGLNDFLCEQIRAYILDDINKSNERIEEARKILESSEAKNPV